MESEGLVKGSQHATPSNTKEAEATSETNRVKQKDGNSKVTMSCHFGVRKRLHHHTQLQLLRSMLFATLCSCLELCYPQSLTITLCAPCVYEGHSAHTYTLLDSLVPRAQALPQRNITSCAMHNSLTQKLQIHVDTYFG